MRLRSRDLVQTILGTVSDCRGTEEVEVQVYLYKCITSCAFCGFGQGSESEQWTTASKHKGIKH